MVLIPVTFAASVYFKVFFKASSVTQSKGKVGLSVGTMGNG